MRRFFLLDFISLLCRRLPEVTPALLALACSPAIPLRAQTTMTYTSGQTNSAGLTTTIANPLTLTLSTGSATQSGNITSTDTGSVVKTGAGTLILSGQNTYTGTTTISAGTLQLGAGGGSGSLNSTGGIVDNGTLIYDRSTASITYPGIISGTGSVIKNNTNTLTLSKVNTYTGTTTVSAGTLLISGSLANTLVSVTSGATLGGSGSIGGLTTVNSGGHLAPGNPSSTLTFTHGLTLAAGSIFDFQLGTTSDLIRVSGGTLTGPASGLITFNLSDAGGFHAGTYPVINYTSALASNFDATKFTVGTAIAGYTYSFDLSGSTLELNAVSAIPEPSTYAAVFGAVAFGFAVLRRRRARGK